MAVPECVMVVSPSGLVASAAEHCGRIDADDFEDGAHGGQHAHADGQANSRPPGQLSVMTISRVSRCEAQITTMLSTMPSR